MQTQLTQETIDQVKRLAAEGLTRADIRLAADISFDAIDYIVNTQNVVPRRGQCHAAVETRGMNIEDKIRYLYSRYPHAQLSQTEIYRCAGIANSPGTATAVSEVLGKLVDNGFLTAATRCGKYIVYYRTTLPTDETAETKEMDFGKCDDLYTIKTLLSEILTELKTLNERSQQ